QQGCFHKCLPHFESNVPLLEVQREFFMPRSRRHCENVDVPCGQGSCEKIEDLALASISLRMSARSTMICVGGAASPPHYEPYRRIARIRLSGRWSYLFEG